VAGRIRVLAVAVALICSIGSNAATPTSAGHPFGLQLPWPSGQHRIGAGGQSYNCGGHTDASNFSGKAIDFAFSTSNAVASVAGGLIVGGSNNNTDLSRGNYLEIAHIESSGHRSRYLHLRLTTEGGAWAAGISIGATVRQGQLIGYSGDTGDSDGPHLHFDLKQYPAGTSSTAAPTASILPEPMSAQPDTNVNDTNDFGKWGFCSTLPNKNSPLWWPDGDGDGYPEGSEVHVGTNIFQRCGTGPSTGPSANWPADLVDTSAPPNSVDKINVADLQSFMVPRRFNTSPGDTYYHPRWDLVPGPAPGLPKWINVQDMSNLAFTIPPMFGGAQRQFSGPTCTNN